MFFFFFRSTWEFDYSGIPKFLVPNKAIEPILDLEKIRSKFKIVHIGSEHLNPKMDSMLRLKDLDTK